MKLPRPPIALVSFLFVFALIAPYARTRSKPGPKSAVPNSAPVAVNDSFQVHGPTQLGNLLVNDFDPDGDGIFFDSYGSLPQHGGLYGPSYAAPSYAPNPAFVGTDSFTYRICDTTGACSAYATVTLNVANNPPTPVDKSFTAHGLTQLGNLLAGDSDPDGDPIGFDSIQTLPQHGGLQNPNLQLPAYGPNYGYTGPDSFTYRICDSLGLCANATVTLDVVNNPPTPVDKTFTVHGLTQLGNLLAGDSDPDGDPFSFDSIQTLPQHGSLQNPNLQLPAYGPSYGYTGADSFTYRMCDSLGFCANATVTLNVVNNPPTPVDKSFTVHGPTQLGNLLTGDQDPDGDSIGFDSIQTLPQHGALQNPNLQFPTYSPNAGFYGLDSFTYRVCDSQGACSNATVTLMVLPSDGAESCGTGSCKSAVGAMPQDSVGEPINVTNGNTYLQQTDYSLPGAGPATNITRTYNSVFQRSGLFGKGWSTDYDEALQIYTSTFVRWFRADGQATNFMRSSGSGPFAPVEGDFHGSLTQNGDSSFTLSFKDGSVHRFSSAGKLLSLVDINGNQTTLTYTSGKLASIMDPFGRVVTATTDSSGRVLTLTDGIGKFATYVYGSSGELTSVTYADTSAFHFSYTTANGNLALGSMTDALGNVVESHTYDAQGRALTSEKQGGVEHYSLGYVSDTETDVTDALGHITKYFFDKSKGRNVVTQVQGFCSCGSGSQTQTWTYDNQLNVISHINALGQTATYTYDGDGNELTGTSVLGTSTFTYNQFRETLTATDAMNAVTTNTYDGFGNLLSVQDALNNTTAFTYDTRGELVTMTNARGKVTTLTYDTSGNISQTTGALGNITKFTYDARGRLTSATDALNFKTSYAYDAAGRLNKITRADNSLITFTYDLAGRRTKVTDPLKFSTTFAYDSAYRLTGVTDALSKSVTYTYDLMSNLVGTTDQLGHTTNVAYDEFNRPTTITYPPAVTGGTRLRESIAYDAVGNVTQRTDTAGRVTTFAYDSANRLTSVTDPLLQVTTYEYNARSNVTAVVDALNQRYTFDYDPLSRVTAMTRAGLQMTYAYDAVGNRTQRTDYNNMTTNYQYDALNRLTKITYPDSTTATYGYDKLSQLTSAANINGTVSFVYDKLRRVTGTTDAWGQAISYVYDVNDRRTQMNLGSTKFATYTYDSIGRLTKITDGAGKSTSYTFDAASNLLTRTLSNGVVSTYTYDGMDRLTRLKDAKSTTVIADNNYSYNNASQIVQNIDESGAHVYGYDALDRLTNASYPATGNEAYAYDAVGNRTSSYRSSNYSYQPDNRLTSTDTASYLYDNNGNMTAKSDSAGTTQLAWDFENRLTQVVTPSTGSVTYKYDALGRRTQRAPSSGVSTNFSYDGADVVRDKNSDATTIDYLNGPGVDNKIWQKGATQYFFSQDHLGSTTALTNTSGVLIERETYDTYGNTAGSAITRYGYTGRERDPLTGLQYNRARFYDPQLGRFITEDPIGLGGGINQFPYVLNNPQNRTDPSGLYEKDVHYYLTYYLALHAGCSDAEAREIANGDQGVDDNPQTAPGPGWKKVWYDPTGKLIWTDPDYRQQQINADYHALHPGSHQPYLDRLWAAASSGGGDRGKLGVYLHYFQDIFSHDGYESPLYGHGLDLHLPDKTNTDDATVNKAMLMARRTWEEIKRFAAERECFCHATRSDPDWALVRKFLEAPSGPSTREINDAELEVKRLILAVPRR
jgi:RHS repeat-associated protein